MQKDEKIILALGFVALAAIVLYVQRPSSVPTADENETIVSNRFNYNQPYYFAPPVANIMPEKAASLLGVPLASNAANSDCGCVF